jgi:hypothetical protein
VVKPGRPPNPLDYITKKNRVPLRAGAGEREVAAVFRAVVLRFICHDQARAAQLGEVGRMPLGVAGEDSRYRHNDKWDCHGDEAPPPVIAEAAQRPSADVAMKANERAQ